MEEDMTRVSCFQARVRKQLFGQLGHIVRWSEGLSIAQLICHVKVVSTPKKHFCGSLGRVGVSTTWVQGHWDMASWLHVVCLTHKKDCTETTLRSGDILWQFKGSIASSTLLRSSKQLSKHPGTMLCWLDVSPHFVWLPEQQGTSFLELS